MWIFNFIPFWVVHAVLFLSVVGLVAAFALSFIPFINKYSIPIKIVSFFLLIVSVWFEGSLSNQAVWEAKVKEMELKVAKAEAKSAELNTKITSNVTKKIEKIKGTTNENVRIVREIISKDDNKCELSTAYVLLHDSASQNVVSPSSGSPASGASNVKASEFLQTVTENYGLYYKIREELLAWQEWYREQKKIYEEVK